MKWIVKTLLVLLVIGTAGWSGLALYHLPLGNAVTRLLLTALFAGTSLSALLIPRKKRHALALYFAFFALVLAFWFELAPSNDRDWQADVAVLPFAEVQGEQVVIRNIRDFDYRSESDFDIRYYDREFHLSDLTSVDFFSVYWMGEAIAHVMVSFGFNDRDYVTFSIETRKERGEEYSSLKGFFRNYELIYVVGDERDLIRLRTDYRRPAEDVYLFRSRIRPEQARLLFMDYIKKINELKDRPEWYNTLTDNCTSNIANHIEAFQDDLRYSWKILLSGYAAEYAYEMGAFDSSRPFSEIKRLGYINPTARVLSDTVDFSQKIRVNVPRP